MKDHWCSSIGLLMLGDCSIELIEETEDDQREVYWIQQVDCVNQCRMEFGYKDGIDRNARQRSYRANNRDQLNARCRARHAHNREHNNAKRRLTRNKQVTCELCGTCVSESNMTRHKKSEKCKRLSLERNEGTKV